MRFFINYYNDFFNKALTKFKFNVFFIKNATSITYKNLYYLHFFNNIFRKLNNINLTFSVYSYTFLFTLFIFLNIFIQLTCIVLFY